MLVGCDVAVFQPIPAPRDTLPTNDRVPFRVILTYSCMFATLRFSSDVTNVVFQKKL